jgi:hypothetical protein
MHITLQAVRSEHACPSGIRKFPLSRVSYVVIIDSESTHWQAAWYRFEFQPFNSWPVGDDGDREAVGEGETLGLEQLRRVLDRAGGKPRWVGISTDTAPSEERLLRQTLPLLETVKHWEEVYVNLNSGSSTALWALLCDTLPLAAHLTTLSLRCNFLYSGHINPPGVVLRLSTVQEIRFRNFIPENVFAPNARLLALSELSLSETSLKGLCKSMRMIKCIELHCISVDDDWRPQLTAWLDDIYKSGGEGDEKIGKLCEGCVDLQFSGMTSVERGVESDDILDLLPLKYVTSAADVKSLTLILLDEPSAFASLFLGDPDWLHMARSRRLTDVHIRPKRFAPSFGWMEQAPAHTANGKWLPTLLGGVLSTRPRGSTRVTCYDVSLSWDDLTSAVWVLFHGAADPQATLFFSQCRIVVANKAATALTWSIPIQGLEVGHLDDESLVLGLRVDKEYELLITGKSIEEFAPTIKNKFADGRLVHKRIDRKARGVKASAEVKDAVMSCERAAICVNGAKCSLSRFHVVLLKVPALCEDFPGNVGEQGAGLRLEESVLPIICYPLPQPLRTWPV